LADGGQILAAMGCPQIAEMHSGGFRDIRDARGYIEVLIGEYGGGKYRTLAIAELRQDLLIGCITIDAHRHFPCAELSYWIAKPYRNMGYATEAVSAILRYGFSALGLARVQAFHSAGNPASGRVLEKAGMSCEGTLRLYDGRTDAKMYAAINTDVLP
jgi:ribosomal-protein-alanine N-acetyltransferase